MWEPKGLYWLDPHMAGPRIPGPGSPAAPLPPEPWPQLLLSEHLHQPCWGGLVSLLHGFLRLHRKRAGLLQFSFGPSKAQGSQLVNLPYPDGHTCAGLY